MDQEFSVDLSSYFVAFTCSQIFLVGEADVLRCIKKLNKTCHLDPIGVSKLGSAFASAASFVADIISQF